MTTIAGAWDINGNGYQGYLTLTASGDNRTFTGQVLFADVSQPEPISGTWDEAAGMIEFTRDLGGGVTQTYTGYLGDNHPERLILSGSFTQSDIQGVARTEFGWVASPVLPYKSYTFSFDNFVIHDTRSLHNDTDYVALSAQVLSTTGYREPISLSRFMGDLNNGTYNVGLKIDVTLRENEQVRFSYVVTNSGYGGSSSQRVRNTLDKISAATKDILSSVYPAFAPAWKVIDEFTQWLNEVFTTDCDGVVAANRVTYSGTDLLQLTANGTYTQKDTLKKASPGGCGVHDQNYDAHWSVQQLSHMDE